MSLADRVLSGALWTFLGAAFKHGARIGLVAVLARLITPAQHGVFVQATIVVGFVQMFVQLGVSYALVQRQDLEPRHEQVALLIALTSGVLGSALLALCATWWLSSANALPYQVLAGALVIRVLAGVPRALLERELQLRTIATIESVAYLCGNGLVTIVLALLGFGFWSLLLGHVAATLLETLLFFRARPTAFSTAWHPKHARDLLAYGTSFTLTRAANYVALQGDAAIIAYAVGPTAASYYSRAYSIMALPASILDAMDATLFPAFAKLQNEPKQLREGYIASLSLVLLVMVPSSALLWIGAPDLVEVLLGPNWKPVNPLLRILAIAVLFRVGYKIPATLARAIGRMDVLLASQLIYAVNIVVGTLIGAHWGVTGATVAVAAVLAVQFVISVLWANRVLELSLSGLLRTAGHSLVCGGLIAAAAAGAVHAARSLQLPSVVRLGAMGLASVVVCAALVRINGGKMLGPDGVRIWQRLRAKFAARAAPAA